MCQTADSCTNHNAFTDHSLILNFEIFYDVAVHPGHNSSTARNLKRFVFYARSPCLLHCYCHLFFKLKKPLFTVYSTSASLHKSFASPRSTVAFRSQLLLFISFLFASLLFFASPPQQLCFPLSGFQLFFKSNLRYFGSYRLHLLRFIFPLCPLLRLSCHFPPNSFCALWRSARLAPRLYRACMA